METRIHFGGIGHNVYSCGDSLDDGKDIMQGFSTIIQQLLHKKNATVAALAEIL
jgi:hypothetical protein